MDCLCSNYGSKETCTWQASFARVGDSGEGPRLWRARASRALARFKKMFPEPAGHGHAHLTKYYTQLVHLDCDLSRILPIIALSLRDSAMTARRAICCVSLRCNYKNVEVKSRVVLVERDNATGDNPVSNYPAGNTETTSKAQEQCQKPLRRGKLAGGDRYQI
eukprot:1823207-Pleurochrysis_carterae.AAC.1